ncbi:MAG: hypothetical protein E7222_11665 [Clostridiales bacterium]|nr:hypothetical protein [Clostridiales bacterium]
MGILEKMLGKEKNKKEQVAEDAKASESETIEIFDEYGRKMLVSKKEWAEKVLPDQIKSHWEDANALYNDILFALLR